MRNKNNTPASVTIFTRQTKAGDNNDTKNICKVFDFLFCGRTLSDKRVRSGKPPQDTTVAIQEGVNHRNRLDRRPFGGSEADILHLSRA